MFNIPMGSLLSAMSTNDAERASLSSARGVGGMIGNMLPAMMFPIFLNMYGDSNPKGYAIGATVCALVGAVICYGHYALTEERNVVEATEKADDIKFTDILNVFKVNRAFLALCIHGVCICTQQSVATSLGTYMYSDVLGNLALMSLASLLSMPLAFVFLGIAPKMAKKFGLEGFIRHGLRCCGRCHLLRPLRPD